MATTLHPPVALPRPSLKRGHRARRVLVVGLIGLVVASVSVGMGLARPYQQAMRQATDRLAVGGSQMTQTRAGPVEYAIFGHGPPVLVIHGVFGGFDQGLL